MTIEVQVERLHNQRNRVAERIRQSSDNNWSQKFHPADIVATHSLPPKLVAGAFLIGHCFLKQWPITWSRRLLLICTIYIRLLTIILHDISYQGNYI